MIGMANATDIRVYPPANVCYACNFSASNRRTLSGMQSQIDNLVGQPVPDRNNFRDK